MMHTFESFVLTLQYHTELNPVVWKGDKLRPEIRKSLLKIADAWAKFSNIDDSIIKDIVLCGGNANYNYTPFSDLDVHLIIDKKKMGGSEELVNDYLFDKKALWTLKHKDIRVAGFPVELYAQDKNEKVASAGIYSLKNDKWIDKPEHQDVNFDKDVQLRRKVKDYMRQINKIIKSPGDQTAELDAFKEKLHQMRSAGVSKGGEFSFENLIYKELRNRGYLDKMSNYLMKTKDQSFSYYPKIEEN